MKKENLCFTPVSEEIKAPNNSGYIEAIWKKGNVIFRSTSDSNKNISLDVICKLLR